MRVELRVYIIPTYNIYQSGGKPDEIQYEFCLICRRFFVLKYNGRTHMKKYTAKYELKDINCAYCAESKKTRHKTCGDRLCPHIMGNLADLRSDEKFLEAVQNAENCATSHRYTLRYLKKCGIERVDCHKYKENHAIIYNVKAECDECQYRGHGFVCYGKDGTCLKDWLKKVQDCGGDIHAGG